MFLVSFFLVFSFCSWILRFSVFSFFFSFFTFFEFSFWFLVLVFGRVLGCWVMGVGRWVVGWFGVWLGDGCWALGGWVVGCVVGSGVVCWGVGR